MTNIIKSPIVYYGGKTHMLKYILPLIPSHKTYVEPFCGGAAVFFAKQPSKVEILNDKNLFLMIFYEMAKTKANELLAKVDLLLHHEAIYKKYKDLYKKHKNLMYKQPTELKINENDKLEIAIMVWYLSNLCYNSEIGAGFAFSKEQNLAKNTQSKKNILQQSIHRIENCQLFTRDALEIIDMFDSRETFFFVDPPYISADQGHYEGYTNEMFIDLLNKLQNIKGKFMLTSYDEEILNKYTTKNKWSQVKISISTLKRKKVEVITINYEIKSLFTLF